MVRMRKASASSKSETVLDKSWNESGPSIPPYPRHPDKPARSAGTAAGVPISTAHSHACAIT